MIALLRVESWRDGELHHSHVVPNLNIARVFMAQQEAAGFHALLVSPRTETERAA
jgi:hypothetical protein